MTLNATHDPALRSWVASANAGDTDFPIQNLPFGRFRRRGSGEALRIGVAIGDAVLDLQRALALGGWETDVQALLEPLATGDLNAHMAEPVEARSTLRSQLSAALAEGSAQAPTLRDALVAQADVEMVLPCAVGDYTDFYTGIHHATTVGTLFRPDQPLMPNYKWVPIGYHGRASSLGVSGQAVRRPVGQTQGAGGRPAFGPSQRLDYELELGAYIGPGNALGESIPIDRAEAHLFGVCLLNDWSARDLQAWEYQPLGPFLAKSFATTVSPWIVTMQALAPFRLPLRRPEGDPEPLPYLDSPHTRERGMLDIALEVWLHTARMREQSLPPERLSTSHAAQAGYWTLAQLVAHHTVNGCNLQSGDLLGTGTLSGPRPEEAGSLLELSRGGRQPVSLSNGQTRTFLEDGDTVIFRGHCERPGARRIGLGEVHATVLSATVPA